MAMINITLRTNVEPSDILIETDRGTIIQHDNMVLMVRESRQQLLDKIARATKPNAPTPDIIKSWI